MFQLAAPEAEGLVHDSRRCLPSARVVDCTIHF